MSYYTHYQLNIEKSDCTTRDIAETLAEVAGDDATFWESVLEGNDSSGKWYDHSVDMQQVSRRYPEEILTLSGQGEDPDDQWVEYHHNGRVQIERMPEWSPPPFDPAKLN